MSTSPTVPGAREHAERLLESAQRRNDRRGEAMAGVDRGVALMREGILDEAIRSLEQAVALADQHGWREIAIEGQLQLGLARLARGEADAAVSLFDGVLASAREDVDPYREKMALDFLGRYHATGRRPEAAIAVYREAQRIAHTLGDQTHEADLTWAEAIQLAELGRRDEAIGQATSAIAIFISLNHPHVGVLAEHLGRFESVGGVLPGLEGAEPIPGVFVGGGRGTYRPATNDSVAPPGLLRMAMSAMKAMSKFIGSGAEVVPAAERERRLTICDDCEHHSGSRCLLCGCFTPLKTWLPYERCPASKWERRP